MAGGTIRDGVLRLDGDLNFATAAACFRNSAEWFGVAGRVTAVDLRDVGAVDSAGLALLLEWHGSPPHGKGGRGSSSATPLATCCAWRP